MAEVPDDYQMVERHSRTYKNRGTKYVNYSGVNHRDILERVKNGDLDVNEAQKMLRQNNRTMNDNSRRYTFRVTNRGAIAVFGLQRRPVILYANQWQKIEQLMPSLKNYVMNNQSVIMNKREQYIQSVKEYHSKFNNSTNELSPQESSETSPL